MTIVTRLSPSRLVRGSKAATVVTMEVLESIKHTREANTEEVWTYLIEPYIITEVWIEI